MLDIAFLLVTAIGASEKAKPIPDHVDLIELNIHKFNADSDETVQLIFWEFDYHLRKYRVQDWHIWSHAKPVPVYNLQTRKYEIIYRDKQAGVLRKITANSYRRSYTDYDPEMSERAIYPLKYRKRLTFSRLPAP